MIISFTLRKRIINFCTMFIFPKSLRKAIRSRLKSIYIDKRLTFKEIINNYFNNKLVVYKKAPKTFSFSIATNPEVSIIIPVYNQYKYTHLCLWAILQHTPDIEYEIIIADDGSKDKTVNIAANIQNITYIKNKQNLGFLKNCNAAVKSAKGKYVLLLNNDTQVQKNWLKPLLSLIKQDKSIGIVGSKLVYPDKTLQEAGGIIWQDATGNNFGRNQDINADEYNYVKEVDYISGASILLSKDLWDELGGFDEEFAPAYYEDTDLAFRVRNRKGLKVVYQPKSVVVHFEGKSHGTDLKSGGKAYQATNAQKFYNRWKDVLLKEHCKPEDIFLARDRGKNKKTMLFIDHQVLAYDQDTGSRVSFQYLQFFKDMGLNIKYLPHHKYSTGPYLEVHRQEGFEVLSSSWYNQNWEEWLKINGKYIDYVYLNRPHIAQYYIDGLKKHTNAKIIYQGHDLHFLREMRRYEIDKTPEALDSSNKFKTMETEVINKSDVVCMFSDAEIAEVKKINPHVVADSVPLFIFDTAIKQNIQYIPQKRKNIMFVGGFRHLPNIDGIVWFVKNVFPQVKAVMPEIKFYLVGSNPPEEILNLVNKDIIVTGYVSDEKLDEIYENIKISVVPLRYGAGVKGKVIEAIYNKVPVITTTIGAEGINNSDELLTICDETNDFAKALIELYQDDERLTKIASKSHAFIDKFYSKSAVKNKFNQWIEVCYG